MDRVLSKTQRGTVIKNRSVSMSRKKRFQLEIKQRVKRHKKRLKLQKKGADLKEIYYGKYNIADKKKLQPKT